MPTGLRRISPTTEYIRNMVFSVIGPERIRDSNFLDLFCGSGAVGLEALSRGAANCTFVDIDSRLVASLTSLIEDWQIDHRTTVVCGDVCAWLLETKATKIKANTNKHDSNYERFNIVFANPPDCKGNPDKLKTKLGYLFAALYESKEMFHPNSILFLEIPRSLLNELPLKSGLNAKRSKTKYKSDEFESMYKHQFDVPWNTLLRHISIPLEFPLYDWRFTSTTAVLVFGARADEPTREIY